MATQTVPGVSASLSAVEMIREDHRRIKSLFREFEAADEKLRPSVADRAIEELELHDEAEQTYLYPALKNVVGIDPVLEARAAHHAMNMTIAELKLMPYGRRFNAKFKVLIDSVLAHMKEEEAELLPAAESSSLDLDEIGRDMAAVKYRELGRRAVREAAGGGFGLAALLIGGVVAAGALWLLSPAE